MPQPIQLGAAGIDLSPRIKHSSTVVGSPAGASETIVASVTVPGDLATALGVLVLGYAAVTVGTSGTALTWKLRQTDTSGTTFKTSGAKTATAGNLVDEQIVGLDVSPAATGQVYVLTLTVTAGAAASTVSAVTLVAIAV
jgi:hypothetical protein